MALRTIGTVVLPPHRGPGGFDHASVHRGADRLYVAHTANDSVEMLPRTDSAAVFAES